MQAIYQTCLASHLRGWEYEIDFSNRIVNFSGGFTVYPIVLCLHTQNSLSESLCECRVSDILCVNDTSSSMNHPHEQHWSFHETYTNRPVTELGFGRYYLYFHKH
ncbi:hypothetical protein KIL84_007738 [Mauremys mutica]|uniref:Uncharacterized protein n=1 Tax=Mauremys mutica TaxID=74926 RepID=A0A9D3X3N6_9SAUR|nr:hypothetical protein KIL84_007738 [Mauremys mutica]